jgi:aminoglycoside phosphotransferase (APT) family kinase protein
MVEPGDGELRERVALAAAGLWPAVRVEGLRRLSGGQSSLTYLVEFAGGPERLGVVKVAPSGLAATRNRDMLRQASAMAALAGVPGVRVPRVLFTDPGGEHAGQLVAMSYCSGESCEPNIDDNAPTATHDELSGRARQAARILAATHGTASAVNAGRGALADLVAAEEPISLEAEITRWDRALATVPSEFGLDWEKSSARLRTSMPAPLQPRLTHGDYRLGNLLCVGAEVNAVIDWEIWAAADPRTDLGWFLISLDGALHPAALRSADGVPSRIELLAEYEAAGGAAVADADWFVALALYKFTATTGLIAKHAVRRGDPFSWGARMIPKLPVTLRAVDDIVAAL